MNAPYDGDRGQGAGSGEPAGGQVPPQQPTPDMYVEDAYAQDPYRAQDLAAQDPVTEALYDRASHPPPPPGTYADPQSLYDRPAPPQNAPDPQVWAQTPAPEPDGPSRHLPYGDDVRSTQFVGVDDLVSQAAEERHEPDAFAHLFRDQQPGGARPQSEQAAVPAPAGPPVPGSAPEPTPVPAAAPKKAGKAASILKSSAVMAAGTMVSRITGFLRTLVMAAAIGVGTLNDSYQVANVLPTMIYILVAGGAMNAVFIPQLVRAMKNDDDGGVAYANRLLTLVIVLLGAVTVICVLAAPAFVQVMSPELASEPETYDLTVTFARFCIPTLFFMGVHVVLGQILNARGRFGAMMWTPVLNNIVIIATFGAFIWAFGTSGTSGIDTGNITSEGVRLLGIGTLLGLAVQAFAMVPYLREAGFKPRLRFDWKGQGLGKTAALAKWTLFFVLANQLGMVVVTQLATAAGATAYDDGHSGTGITAYNYALLLWQMPQAIITVSVMTAVLPRISRAANDGDAAAVRDDLSYGLRTSAVAIVPCAFAFLALGVPITTLLYAGTDGATNIGYVLMAFGLGLIPYSVQYVVLRGFYAYEDTRTPFYNTVIVAAVNALASLICYLVLDPRWAVVGMAASYGLAYAVGVGVAWRRLGKRLGGDLDGSHVVRTYARLIGASIPAALLGGAVAFGLMEAIGKSALGSFAALVGGGIVLLGVFFVAARRMRVQELNALVGMVRGRLGR
ncbi:murein biosynthesis integral membrane protein MurJ [Streptomyces cavernicola]|uniref:Murein biosynthesis integral membrane protein MurJ n=1 Tax=Streptomyces cavernicola TaxID=3043613 RepID=A0ABT6S5R0_9ACTN|nr:murein biosynthesis integral membrane protein MurJ [Streptomyces sp. B-S-A6]MDI3402758.1 murein biosynthesis integral membrane protein MurJ [Streptomyces sp. B-S-A6]